MKYEAVFGNQELFDGAGTFTGLDVVVHSIASGIKSYARLSDLTPESLRSHPVCAMRRIIAEPKHWTVADQKAGRLPEVGSKYLGKNELNPEAELICDLIDGDECVWGHDKNKKMFCFYASNIKPIETPTEKAQREEDEFVESTCRQNEPHSTLYSDGVRAAYRKLKGGE